MADHDDRRARAVYGPDVLHHLHALAVVETGRWFVEQQELRVDGNQAAERDRLALPLRKIEGVDIAVEVQQLEHMPSALFNARVVLAVQRAQPERDFIARRVLADLPVGVLKQETDVPRDFARAHL